MEFHHLPVLLNECLDGLNLRPDGTYLDCTLGGAGHSSEIFRRLGAGGTLIGIDRDSEAIAAATARMASLEGPARFVPVRGNFHDAKALLAGLGVGALDGVLADLGVSSHQLDERERGFSYHDDAPLDMRMDASQPLSARKIVNEWPEDALTEILRDYGEEKWARQIARVICDRRASAPIERTSQLVGIVDAAIPKKFRAKDGSHPARRTFQALRIDVNNEFEVLYEFMEKLPECIKPGGRAAILTFHSGEDRLVKKALKSGYKAGIYSDYAKDVIRPSAKECAQNGRARSTKMRWAIKK